MNSHGLKILTQLPKLEKALEHVKGFYPMTDWWKNTYTRFYQSGKMQLVIRCGRRAGKSSTIARIAVLEALYGEHYVPKGDVGTVAIVSVNRGEAAQRLRMIKAILMALKVPFHAAGDSIELTQKNVVFKVFAGSIGGVSGFTSICFIGDEVSKWKDAKTNANPAREVLASAYPTMAGHDNAKCFLISSPMGMNDAHYDAFEEGETDYQCVAQAATWVARPGQTQEKCEQLARGDRSKFLREYAAIPQGSSLGVFDPEDVDAMIRDPGQFIPLARPIGITDSSAGRSDDWTWCFAKWVKPAVEESDGYLYLDIYNDDGTISAKRATPVRDENGYRVKDPNYDPKASKPFLLVYGFNALEGKFSQKFDSDDAVDFLVKDVKKYGADKVHGDGYQSYFITTALAKKQLSYVTQNWTSQAKVDAIGRLRQWMKDRTIVVAPGPEADKLRRELMIFEEKITPGGHIGYSARQGGKDDRVALLMNIAMADIDGKLMGSPIQKGRGRYDW